MSFLVDTNVLAEMVRPRPDPGASRWLRDQERLHVSAITIEEILFGLAWRPKPRVARALHPILAERCEVHPVDEDVASRAGRLRGQLQAMGRPRTQADMLIVATAAQLGFVLVTRNVSDFEGCGVQVLDPFDDP